MRNRIWPKRPKVTEIDFGIERKVQGQWKETVLKVKSTVPDDFLFGRGYPNELEIEEVSLNGEDWSQKLTEEEVESAQEQLLDMARNEAADAYDCRADVRDYMEDR